MTLNLPLAEVRKIHDEFVAVGSMHEINVSSGSKGKISIALSEAEQGGSDTMPSGPLDAALKEIVVLLEADAFPRFLQSPEFSRYSTVGSHDETINVNINPMLAAANL